LFERNWDHGLVITLEKGFYWVKTRLNRAWVMDKALFGIGQVMEKRGITG